MMVFRKNPTYGDALWFDILVYLFRPSTGERKIYATDAIWDLDDGGLSRYIWEDGNFSCDCNRSRFLYDNDEDRHLPCTGSEIFVEKIVAKDEPDTVLYSEMESIEEAQTRIPTGGGMGHGRAHDDPVRGMDA